MNIVKILYADRLCIKIMDNREDMGYVAGNDISNKIRELLLKKDELNIIFAAAPSQQETLDTLIKQKDIDWSRINAFHMDEYIGLEYDAPQRFGRFLKDKIFSKLNFKNIHYIEGNATDIDEECERYAALIKDKTIDIVCLGIGENAHIAFNDPWVADFNDKKIVKVVKLDDICRSQQVNDGCFDHLDKVPVSALTLTIPALFKAENLFCSVPAKTKAQAVYNTVNREISHNFPSTIMRKHPNAIMYCDNDSASLL